MGGIRGCRAGFVAGGWALRSASPVVLSLSVQWFLSPPRPTGSVPRSRSGPVSVAAPLALSGSRRVARGPRGGERIRGGERGRGGKGKGCVGGRVAGIADGVVVCDWDAPVSVGRGTPCPIAGDACSDAEARRTFD